MKLTNLEIFNARGPLETIGLEKLPVKTSLALVKLMQKLGEFLGPIQKVRDGLIRTYGAPVAEQAGQIGIKPGDKNWDKYYAEYQELMAQEVEVVIEKVILPDTLEVSTAILMPIEKFISIAEPKKINK